MKQQLWKNISQVFKVLKSTHTHTEYGAVFQNNCFNSTSPVVLARAIRSLLGDHAIHSTGLGSCFSPTCRKAGIFLAEKMLIKIRDISFQKYLENTFFVKRFVNVFSVQFCFYLCQSQKNQLSLCWRMTLLCLCQTLYLTAETNSMFITSLEKNTFFTVILINNIITIHKSDTTINRLFAKSTEN